MPRSPRRMPSSKKLQSQRRFAGTRVAFNQIQMSSGKATVQDVVQPLDAGLESLQRESSVAGRR